MSKTFKGTVLATASVADAFHKGLKAVSPKDRQRIVCKDGKRLAGSVNLDEALSHSHPNDPRWDYGIGKRVGRSQEFIVWVEVHAASSNHIRQVIDKLNWLKKWLKEEAPSINELHQAFVWVASGKVSLTANSPQRRRVAQLGIHFAGERLDVCQLKG